MDARALPGPGTLVDGRYRLVGLLGEGSFGGVWRAQDTRLAGRSVAVKFLKVEFLARPETVARFDAEADALAQVAHPNVVGVIDRGEWQGQRFMVTEYVEGRVLTAWIQDHRATATLPDISVACGLFDQTCAGIEAAHAVRTPGAIVHRDIKPDNVLVRTLTNGEQVVKVVDFGIAQLGRRSGTQTGMLMGTPNYMAPEQAFGHATGIGPWTDVFALCVLLTEMLSLRAQPVEGEPWWGASLRRPQEIRSTLTALRADVPPGIWDVVAQGLIPTGSERFQDAGALRRALRPLVQALPHPPRVHHGPFGRPSVPSVVPQSVPPGVPGSFTPPAPVPPLEAPPVALSSPVPVTRFSPQAPAAEHWSDATVAAPAQASPATLATAVVPVGVPSSGAATPWGRVALGVLAAAVLAAAGIVATVVAYDTRHAAPVPPRPAGNSTDHAHPMAGDAAVAPQGPRTAPTESPVSPAPTAPPAGVGPGGVLDGFLAGWYHAVRRDPGAVALETVYAPAVRWHASDHPLTPAEIRGRLDDNVAQGGWLWMDWGRTLWEARTASDPDLPDECDTDDAQGDAVKVRAWAVEYKPQRAPAVGCPRIEGRYLVWVRQMAGGYRVCHESWSLAEGICVSCPTARACQGR